MNRSPATIFAIGRKPNISLTEKVGLGSIMLAARKTGSAYKRTTKAKGYFARLQQERHQMRKAVVRRTAELANAGN